LMKRQFLAKKQRNVSDEWLALAARVLETTVDYLIEGDEGGAEHVRHPTRVMTSRREIATNGGGPSLSVVGKVVAGTWLEASDPSLTTAIASTQVPIDPGFPAANQYAVKVEGTAINRFAQHGDYLIVARDVVPPQAGDLVIVQRISGNKLRELTAKRYYPQDHSVELRHDSTDPRYRDPDAPGYQPPVRVQLELRDGAPYNGKIDDDTAIEIKGVVIGLWRPAV
jgi:SOS-response transcriptional repressor LexA